jgi:hypothetical protein
MAEIQTTKTDLDRVLANPKLIDKLIDELIAERDGMCRMVEKVERKIAEALAEPGISGEKLEKLERIHRFARPEFTSELRLANRAKYNRLWDVYVDNCRLFAEAERQFKLKCEAHEAVLDLGLDRVMESLSDARLAELRQRIKPVYLREIEGKEELWYMEPVDPKRQTFVWDPKPTTKAEGLEEIAKITTYHRFGAPIFFKPSEKEVLAQLLVLLPEEQLRQVIAFRTEPAFPNYVPLMLTSDGGYHVAVTTLYKRREVKGISIREDG